MIDSFQSIYSNNKGKIYWSLIFVMFVFYIVKIVGGAGGDLSLRVSEAKYFLHGINPYDVYVGRIEKIEGFGSPHAYSFFSYYFASLLTIIGVDFWQKILFSIIDILSLTGGVLLANRLLGIRDQSDVVVVVILLSSVFFWQHVGTLNYNLIVTFGLLLTFYGLHQSALIKSFFGLMIIGLKPSIAIPTFFYLIFTGRWKLFFLSTAAYFSILILTAAWLDSSPIDLVLQLKDTQRSFSNGHTDGFFFFAKPILGSGLNVFCGLISLGVIYFFRGYINEPLKGLMVVIALGLGLFYNHVHAWIICYPLLIVAFANCKNMGLSIIPLISLLIFILAPRLAGFFDENSVDLYVSIHNVLRFGLLFIATCLLIKSRRSSPEVLTSKF